MAGILGALAKSAATWADNSGWLADWARGGTKSATGISVSQLKAMQETTCMACVMIRAGDLAKAPVHAFRLSGTGEQSIYEGSAAERLLRRPNDWQTPLEFIEQMQGQLLLKSNAYAPIIRNGRGEPISLIPVNSDQAQIYDEPGGSVFYRVTPATDFQRGQLAGLPDMIPASEMFHLRGLSTNGLTGLSRIWLMREALGLSLAQEQTAASFFGNGAIPGIAFATDKNVPPDLEKRLEAKFEQNHGGGLRNAWKFLLLSNGAKPVDLMTKLVDAQFIEIWKQQREIIAMGYEVPKHRLGMAEQGDILKVHQMYLNNTIATDAARWQAALNRLFGFDGVNTFIEFDLDQFNIADPVTRAEMGRLLFIGGQRTPNELRRMEGLGPKPGGDDLYRGNNQVPMDTPADVSGTGPGSDGTGKPAPGGDGDPSGNPGKGLRNGHDASQTH